jgi:hypothetical protein
MGKRSRSTAFPKRRSPKREPYDRVLIVIEGRNTELYYFQALIDHLKLSTANVEVDPESGSAPQSVVQYAKQRYKNSVNSGDAFDRVYCVFDKDQHPGYPDAVNAVKIARPANIFYLSHSVPCFEYWLLLHFEYTARPYNRRGQHSPCKCVTDDLRQYLPDYDKGDRNTFSEKLLPLVQTALANAERANREAEQHDTDNPSTRVNLLVQYLYGLKSDK